VCIVIVVNIYGIYGFTPWYSHCVIQATEPQTARLLDAVTVFGGELDSLGKVRGVSMGQGGIWLVTFLQIYLNIMQNPSF
jgi:hypothetical protein